MDGEKYLFFNLCGALIEIVLHTDDQLPPYNIHQYPTPAPNRLEMEKKKKTNKSKGEESEGLQWIGHLFIKQIVLGHYKLVIEGCDSE